MTKVGFLICLLSGIVLLLGGLIPPFGPWEEVRSRVRGAAAFVVVASAPIGMPFILEDNVVLGVYAVFALGALLWGGLRLRDWLSQRKAPELE